MSRRVGVVASFSLFYWAAQNGKPRHHDGWKTDAH